MKNEIMKGASILTVVLMISMVFTPLATAAPILPHNRWGDTIPINNDYVYAFINGVQYGGNATQAAGLFSIDVMGDDVLLPDFKSGGINGDTIQYVKSANANGGLRDGAGDIFYTETGIFSSGSTNPNADLNEVGTSPDLLKINMVSVDSDLTGVTDYIVLYNPTGLAVDATAFEIVIDGAVNAIDIGDLVAGLYDWNLMSIPPAGYLALDMGALVNTDGYIMLQETAAPKFIVDRVEYWDLAIAFNSPDDTIMGDATAPANGQEIFRNTPGEDTNECDDDFNTQVNWLPIDTTAPTSAVDAIAPYWYNTSPLAITATADDIPLESGIDYVELWYSHEGGGDVLFGTDSDGFPYTWDFDFTVDGEGGYEFYSIAVDIATNSEVFTVYDTTAGYDATIPAAGAGADMLLNIATQKTDATATDALSGVFTTVWTYDPGVICSNDNILDPSFSASGDGTYTVTLTVTDNAGNIDTDTFQLTWDGTPPEVTTTVPLDEAIDVVIASAVYVIQFNEPMDTSIDEDAAITDDLPGAGTWAFDGTGMWCNKTYDVLANDFEYTIDISTGGFEDIAGNALIPGAYDWTFNFTTIPAALRQAWVTDPTNDPAWTNVAAVTILYGEINDPTVVELYYTLNTAAPYSWTWFGTETPTNGAFNWACTLDGAYGWFAQAEDEAAPVDGVDVPEVAAYQYDATDPTSSVDALAAWYTTSPTAMTATSNDAMSGIASVILEYSYEGGAWTPGPWSFNWPSGQGNYEFRSIATDNAGNVEVAPGTPDQTAGYDFQAPTTSVNALPAAWNSAANLLINATGVDNGPSGMASMELFYQIDAGGYVSFGSIAWPAVQWDFIWGVDGTYDFYSIGTDVAGNVEVFTVIDQTVVKTTGFAKFAAATGLVIAKNGADDLDLTWTNPTASDFWDIYQSSDKYNVVLPGNLIATVPDGTGTYTNLTAQSDGYNWFYLVIGRGSDASESGYSTMVYKIVNTLYSNDPASGVPNVNFVSLPWDTSYYPNSFSIIADIEGSTAATGNGVPWNITAVQRWAATSYGFASTSSYSPGPFPPEGWTNNYVLNPGDGIALTLTDHGAPYPSTWDWVMIGSDVVDTFTLYSNDPASGVPNVNFVSIPITADYPDSFSIIADIEGSTAATGNGVPWNITAVQRWDATSYGFASTSSYSPGPFPPEGWTNNYVLNPGDGIALTLTDHGAPYPSTWDWTISLITPVVP